ncbi:MAG TPA: hypothetical protein VF134_03625 [Candidatus Dormibacteraeota bacterium]
MEILELPFERPAVSPKKFDFQGLSDVLFESADLLEEARGADDPEFLKAAVELAVRSLYTASAALDRHFGKPSAAAAAAPAPKLRAAIVSGPWPAAQAQV